MQQLLTTLTMKHAELTSSYVQQSQTLNQLHKRIADISAELEVLRFSQTWSLPGQQSNWDHSNDFDAFTFTTNFQTPSKSATSAMVPTFTSDTLLPQFEHLVRPGEYIV